MTSIVIYEPFERHDRCKFLCSDKHSGCRGIAQKAGYETGIILSFVNLKCKLLASDLAVLSNLDSTVAGGWCTVPKPGYLCKL